MPAVRLLSFALLAALMLSSPTSAQEGQRRARSGWDGFPVFVWWHKGPEARSAAYETLRQADLGGTNAEASQPSDTQALVGIDFYVGHVAGKGDLHLRPETFQPDHEQLLAAEEVFRPVRPTSLSDPAELARLLDLVRQNTIAHRKNRPLAYALDDEISVTSGVSPMDYCFAGSAMRELQGWLQRKYPSLQHLNEVWETSFSSAAEIVPLTTAEARARNADRPVTELNFASWSDHREFMEFKLAQVLGLLVDEVKRVDPGVPVGFLGGQAPSAFGGFDWWLLTRKATFFEAYDHGMAPKLIHDFKTPGTRVVSTWFLSADRGEEELALAAQILRSLARGDDGAVIWSADTVFVGGEKPALSKAAQGLSSRVIQLRRLQQKLRGYRPAAPQVLVYHSQPSVRAGWMLDSWQDGDTWPRRLTSYEYEHSTSVKTREAWGQLLSELGLPWSFIDSRELVRRGGTELPAGVLILNEATALSDREVHELVRFAAAGGLLIADARTALFDGQLRGRDSSALTALFGLERDPRVLLRHLPDVSLKTGKPLFEMPPAEVGLRPARGGQVSRTRTGWLKEVGKGKAVFLDLDLSGYLELGHKQPQFAESLRRMFAGFLAENSNVELDPHLPYDSTCRQYLLRRFRQGRSDIALIVPREPVPNGQRVNLVVSEPVEMQDLYGDVPSGIRRRMEVRVDLRRPGLIRIDRDRRDREER